METTGNIQLLKRKEIEDSKWNNCISNAGNGLIYGYSYYLDAMVKHWDALVLGDYDTVMPLTRNKKYGIHYLYQPPFTASLGVFGNNISPPLLNDFLLAIPKKFRYWDISLNHGNFFQLSGFNLYERINYTLSLKDNYDSIAECFRDNIKRNVKKSEQLKDSIQKDINVEAVIVLAKEQLQHFTNLSDSDFEQFKKLFGILYDKEMATSYGIRTSSGQLIASAAFFFSHQRAYYILVGNHPNGKTSGASHALINTFIKDHAGQNVLLDFEGSDIRNLAFFYSSFGATEEKYAAIKLNRLPLYLRWLKK